MAFPSHTKYLVIGAGIHGLSTAFHLARELKCRGRGSGEDVLVVDKTSIEFIKSLFITNQPNEYFIFVLFTIKFPQIFLNNFLC